MYPIIQPLIKSLAPLGNPNEKERRRIIHEVIEANAFPCNGVYWRGHYQKPTQQRARIIGSNLIYKGLSVKAHPSSIIPLILKGVKVKGLRAFMRSHQTEIKLTTKQSSLLSSDQIPFVQEWLSNPRLICGHEMGKGKTATAIIALNELYQGLGNATKTVICTTKSTIPNWIDEINKFGFSCTVAESPLDIAQICKRTKAIKAGKPSAIKQWRLQAGLFAGDIHKVESNLKEAGIIICTHDAMSESGKLLNMMEGINTLIVDEAHIVANKETERGWGICHASEFAKNIMLLTGTPINKVSHQELYFYMRVLFPHMVDDSFIKENFITKKDGLKAFYNVELLQGLLNTIMPGRLIWDKESKKEYLNAELKIVIDTITPSPEDLKAIQEIEDSEAHAFTKNAQTNKAIHNAKLNQAIKLIEDQLKTGKKAVVFSAINSYLHDIKKIYGEKAVLLTGATANRGDVIGKFKNNPAVKVFLGNIIAAGTGINLQNTDKVIIIESGYRRQDVQQAIARVYRRGNLHDTITCHYIEVAGVKLDVKKLAIINRKTTAVNKLIDNTEEGITKADYSAIVMPKEQQIKQQQEKEKLIRKQYHNTRDEARRLLRATMTPTELFIDKASQITQAFLKSAGV